MRYILICTLFVYAMCVNNYKTKRAKLLTDEKLISIGGKIILTDKEDAVNNCLMKHKFREVDYAFDNPEYFNFSQHFFSYKDKMKYSKVYQMIKHMPKGAALHIHDMGILGPDYLLNLTYTDGLYVCLESKPKMLFSDKLPIVKCQSGWKLMKEARRTSKDIIKFDAELRKHFTLVVDNPDDVYPTIKESWFAFMDYFTTVIPLLTYRPVWEQYFYDVLKKFREDNILYVEVRSILPSLYELDGTVYEPLITAKAYKKTINRFLKNYPDFVGAKLIYAPSRRINTYGLSEYLQLARKIKEEMPDYFAGFDLVGQEDLGSPLVEFVPQLQAAAKDYNYFFHAGETDWYGTLTDENLVDAILLGAKRLGHAYALPKHPLLVKEVIENDIGLEVNVISNTVLSLVRDVRNHPLSNFFAHGLPVVLSSDDPGAWEAEPLSDDFYVAFVGVASRLSDLRLLKALALNSLKYSALEPQAKVDVINKFNLQWNLYINKFNCTLY